MSTEQNVEQRRAWWDLLGILLPVAIAAVVGLIVLIDAVDDDDADDGAGATVEVETEDGGGTEGEVTEGTEGEAAEGEAAEATTIVDLAVATPELSTLTGLVVDAGLDATLAGDGPFTVLAPTNDAFDAAVEALGGLPEPDVLEQILLYHVIPAEAPAADVVTLDSATTVQGEDVAIAVDGDAVVLNDGQATVTTTDVRADNGIVHIIDGVLLPPSVVEAIEAEAATAEEEAAEEEEAAAEEEAADAGPATVVDLLAEDGRFTALVGAVGDLGLAETLSGPGPFTVLAPTDEAFASAAEALGSDIEDPELLTQVLTYHVINTRLDAELALTAGQFATIQGEAVTFEEVDGDVVVAGTAVVTEADLEAGNGIVHVIDAVLLPPSIVELVAG